MFVFGGSKVGATEYTSATPEGGTVTTYSNGLGMGKLEENDASSLLYLNSTTVQGVALLYYSDFLFIGFTKKILSKSDMI